MKVGERRTLPTPQAQRELGAELARELPPGGLLFLEGELGSGKTTLAQGMVAALGFAGEVSSPTYALMQLYPTLQGQVLHVDAYRVRHPGELYSMDFGRLIDESRFSLVEWGQLFYADFPHAWRLQLNYEAGGRSATRLR